MITKNNKIKINCLNNTTLEDIKARIMAQEGIPRN